jgi:simple sugar transport system permease protein
VEKRMKKISWTNIGFQIGALLVVLLITTIILLIVGAPPLKVYPSIVSGAFGSVNNFEKVLITWSPLLLTTAGVLITFSAGLWNIGIEGQMTLGAIFATGMLRLLQDSSFLLL